MALNKTKRKLRYFWRKLKPFATRNTYIFAILCIKKTIYADMVIENINSLHYLNPTHTVVLYCDTLCFEYLTTRKNQFDYPAKVNIKKSYDIADKAWQYYKIEVHIEAARNNQVDTDADGVWHDDPVIDRTKITMLAEACKIADRPEEVKLMEEVFHKKEWVKFNHRVAAFVSMPPKYMTEKVANDMRYINDKIFTNPLIFLDSDIQKNDMRRLSEEFAVNLALQSNFPNEDITILKKVDGPDSRESLQSLYYGCFNRVTE